MARPLGVAECLAAGVGSPVLDGLVARFSFRFALAIPAEITVGGDGILRGLEPLIFLGFLTVSYLYYHKGKKIEAKGNA